MDRALVIWRTRLHRSTCHALAGALLCALAVTADATTGDGLAISGSPASKAWAGQSYSFVPTVSNPKKRRLVFTVANKPAWATFNTSDGRLSGTPAASYAGKTTAGIAITVHDGLDEARKNFSITVLVDRPVISGTPPRTGIAGRPYRFQPSAHDPEGRTVSFSVKNKPAWASFSIATGLLDGTPRAGQKGTYRDVAISASNGRYSSELAPFSVTVEPATGSATLSWVMPTRNTDGSPLTDLAGVIIRYGTSESALTRSLQLSDPTATSHTFSGLAAGTWYFAAEAYTALGEVSEPSPFRSKTIQ